MKAPFSFGSGSAVVPLRTAATHAAHPKTFEDVVDIPRHAVLLTANGRWELGERLHSKLAAFELDTNIALILCDQDSYNRHDFASLHENLKKEYAAINIGLAKASLILRLYSKLKPSGAVYRDRDTDEEALSRTMFFDIMSLAAQQNASDVHIVVRDIEANGTAAILFRIDGILRRVDKIPAKNAVEVIGIAYTKLAEERSRSDTAFNIRTMQSCTIAATLNDANYKIRYQTLPANGGIDAVMRLLHSASADASKSNEQDSKTLSELGYSETQCHQLELAARKTVGAIIVSGVTGSGKSTTLKTLMTSSKTRSQRKSYSIEDPVEYKIFGVTQISVQRRADEGGEGAFSAAMRVVLRADPDLVMVGEVRDGETCSLLKTMVQSGHQVMTTVHAASAIDIVQRLTSNELGLPRDVLSSRNFLSALVYQRLVPLMCPACKIPLRSTESDVPQQTSELLREKFRLDISRIYTTSSKGCEKCSWSGSRGVTVVAEVIPQDAQLARYLRASLDVEAEDHWRSSRTAGFHDADTTGKTAFEHGLYKVQLGIVDPLVIENAFEPFETYDVHSVGHRTLKPAIHAVTSTHQEARA